MRPNHRTQTSVPGLAGRNHKGFALAANRLNSGADYFAAFFLALKNSTGFAVGCLALYSSQPSQRFFAACFFVLLPVLFVRAAGARIRSTVISPKPNSF